MSKVERLFPTSEIAQASIIQIAVVGGGPKSAALAAKAKVLRDQDIADFRVTIFEPNKIGAYWAGQTGYTDGEPRLCTIAERDVGYPYNSMFGREVDIAMATEFSWGRFLHDCPLGYEQGYSTWVDAGRKPPLHKHVAEYFQWVVSRASPTVVEAAVTELASDRGRWRIKSQCKTGTVSTHLTRFDAVIVTGPGPAKHIPITGAKGSVIPAAQIFDGSDFGLRQKAVHACLKQAKKDSKYDAANPIVIVGAGGTAAAILSWLVANGAKDLPIQMVANQASLYTRIDSVFENRIFSDETQWTTLSPTSRKAFFDRLNRRVVWATVMDQVSSATNFTMVDGRAERLSVSNDIGMELTVRRGDEETVRLRPSMLVDASGFDAWWFLSLVKGLPAKIKKSVNLRPSWEQGMGESLQLLNDPWVRYPPLHAPMLSSHVGPGFGSLMVLGAMADRVLKAHL
jgi:mycobactin lysine-N-oxygenase